MSNNKTEVTYYLNNRTIYADSDPPPRSDTYGRNGWFYTNYKQTGTISDQQCNINIYNIDDTRATDAFDSNNFLFLSNIRSLYFEFTSLNTNTTNLSTETVMDYYPYLVIGTKTKSDGADLSADFRSKIYLKISPTDNTGVTDKNELTYLYRNGKNVIYFREKPLDKEQTYQTIFKNEFSERDPSNNDNIELEQISKIWIETKGFPTAFTTGFILHEAGLASKNFTNNFYRVFKFENILTNLITNNEELVLHNANLSGLTANKISTYGYKNCVILADVTATTGSPQKDIFLSYSMDDVSYYTDSKNIICQEFGTTGTYTGVITLENVGFQYIKIYADDAHITNVKIAYSVYN